MKAATSPLVPATDARPAPFAPALLVALGIHLLGLTATAASAPSDLDLSFGTGGLATVSFGTVNAAAVNAVAIQPDGTVDSGFGTGAGSPIVNPNSIGAACAVGLQPSGKILVAGTSSVDG